METQENQDLKSYKKDGEKTASKKETANKAMDA